MLRSKLCDYSDAYIVVKGTITIVGTNANNRIKKELAFKNNASFRSGNEFIRTFIDNTESLDIYMIIYNLLEYSDNYSMASGSLWKYHRDERI